MSRASDPLDTPFMRQYLELKSRYPDAILFFRMGDFYELFLDDARLAAPLMDVALTKRTGDIPMCGVPHHSCDIYIQRLLQAGQKIAIAEQKVDPSNAKLMSRHVVRVVSPGTLIEDDLLSPGKSSYLMAVVRRGAELAVAFADISTGEFFVVDAAPVHERSPHDADPALLRDVGSPAQEASEQDETGWNGADGSLPSLRDLFVARRPCEIIATTDFVDTLRTWLPDTTVPISPLESWKGTAREGARRLEAFFGAQAKAFGFEEEAAGLGAVALVLHYVAHAFPEQAPRLEAPAFRENASDRLLLEEKTIRNLNLFEPVETSLASLFSCRTAVGRRRLRDIILRPLLDRAAIERRQSTITALLSSPELRERVQTQLGLTFDLERILSRMDGGRGRPADFRSIISTIQAAEQLATMPAFQTDPFSFFECPPSLHEFARYLDSQIVEEPAALPGSSPFLRAGIHTDLDNARSARDDGARWILELEEREQQATGIPNLKIRYNRVTGYTIEISKTQTRNAPDHYERKQTLVGGERYTTAELKDIERKILSADAVIEQAEQQAFDRLSTEVLEHRSELRYLMQRIAYLDILQAFANAAESGRWVAPQLVDSGEILLEEARHPVVERFLPAGVRFTPNDVHLNQADRSFALLTGPNMAGKSTYIRQVALIQLLAQMGSYVPAKRARITPADRIFTRIGAQDDLARGESTFFVEMLETSAILRKFTERSLIIMDEVGRGTSTYDGLSIAWAVSEYLTDRSRRPRVLFATHYHELTALAERPGVFNLTMDVREVHGRVVFLHRVREGTADRSYGLHVARLAGLPRNVVDRAGELLQAFEQRSLRESEALELRGTPDLQTDAGAVSTDQEQEPSTTPPRKASGSGGPSKGERRGRHSSEDGQATLF